MYVKPCRNCHKNSNCQRRNEIHVRLKGSGITSAKFTCPEFSKGFFNVGDRVRVLLTKRFEYMYEDVHATVCGQSKTGKVTVYFDEDPFTDDCGRKLSHNLFCRFWPKHLQKVNGYRSVCSCGLPKGEKQPREDWFCKTCNIGSLTENIPF